jgi:hydrogenase/urease accessory protein HupE
LERCARELYVITDAGAPLRPERTQVILTEENDVETTLLYPLPTTGPLRFDAVHLKRLPDPTYGATLTVSAERVLFGQQLLRASESTLEVDISGGPPSARRAPVLPSFWQYVRLGVEHILTGYDHLLFLAGLLLACRRFQSVLAIVTSFTAAHSLTLALSAMGVFALPSKVAEPLIAATIVFVGVENLVRGDEPRWRRVLAFFFGLIHGFGFASALRATGIGLQGAPLAMPLFSFNLGVEIGQVAVVAVFLPVLGGLSAFPPFARYGRPLFSVIVAAMGLFWLIERVAST